MAVVTQYPPQVPYSKCLNCGNRIIGESFLRHLAACLLRSGKNKIDDPTKLDDPRPKWSPFVQGGLPGQGKKK